MSTVIGLGVQFTANASGMTKGLSQVDRQLQKLGQQASSVGSLFNAFTASSDAAVAAQQRFATDLGFLNSAFKTGQISAEQYATELKAIVADANASAAAFAEGARITDQVATAEEKRAGTLKRLADLLQQGAISQQTYERAAADASGANASAAKAEADRASALARAASITQANLTPQQKYDQKVQELNQHLVAGRITQDTYNNALNNAARDFAKATLAADKYDAAADDAGTGNTLAFNELSGILAALPGPIGNVAGRISGLASAGEGLGRVFAGGLSQGFGALASSAAALVNPITAGIAAVVGLGAAATAVGRGLIELERRVEQLGFAAEQLGTDFSTIQTLEEAAKRTGVSFEALTNGLQKFAVKLDESRDSSTGAAKAFDELGISQEQLAGLSLPQQADLVATALAGVEDPARRAALQMELLGKSGENVRRGFTAIEESSSALDKFNARISELDKERIAEFGTAFDDVKTAIMGLGTNLLTPFAGLAEGIATAIAEAIGGITAIIEPLGDLLAPVLDAVGAGFGEFGKTIGLVGNIIGKVLGVALTPLINLFSVLAPALNPVAGVLGLVNASLEFMVGIIDGAIAAWNRFSEGIPLVGEYMTIATDEVNAGLGEVRANAEQPIDVPEAEFEALQTAIEKTNAILSGAIDEAVAFGQAGFDAAFAFQEQLKELNRQLEAGILNEEAYRQEVERAREAHEQTMDAIKEEQRAEEELARARQRAAEQAIEDDRRRADAAIERNRVDREFGGDTARAEATDNLSAIRREQARVEQEIADARARGDEEAVRQGERRLQQLEQAEAREEDIASGNKSRREEEARDQKKKFDEIIANEKRRREEVGRLNEQYAERAAEIERDRLDALAQRSNEALTGNDLRTSAGASQFLAIATGREDPAVEEYRKQLRELQDIKREIAKANAPPVQI